MVFLRKIMGYNNFKNNLIDKGFSIGCFSIFKSLDKRDIFNRNFASLAKTEDVDTGACPDRGKKVIERGGR